MEIKKILIPTDFSDLSLYAIDYAVNIANIQGSNIHLFHVIEELLTMAVPGDFYLNTEEIIQREVEILALKSKQISELASSLEQKYQMKFSTHVEFGRSHRVLTDYANENKFDLIVMSTHGVSGFREFIIGSNAVRVISEADCPVLSIQNKMPDNGIRKILMPFKDDPYSRQKVKFAINYAKWFNAELITLGIDTEVDDMHLQKIEREAAQIKEIVDENKIPNRLFLTQGNAAKEILKCAKEQEVDLILVMADMENEDVVDFIMGPTAQQLINHSKVPVLSIQPTRHPSTIDLHPYGW